MTKANDFPQEAIVGSLGDLARTMAAGTEVPEEFYFACGLTILGAMCSGDLSVNSGIAVDTRLYTVLLGESSDVKKSTAMRKSLDFFKKLPVAPKFGLSQGLAAPKVWLVNWARTQSCC